SPRLEDAGLKDCALPPESIADAFSSLLRPSPPASYTSPSPTTRGETRRRAVPRRCAEASMGAAALDSGTAARW
ncbi:unnamed protein product, partial [Urochloa humidicola]